MSDWSYHELALAIGYRALGERTKDIAAYLGRSSTEVGTLMTLIKVLDDAEKEKVADALPYLRKRRIAPALTEKLGAIRVAPIPGTPPEGRSALDQLKKRQEQNNG